MRYPEQFAHACVERVDPTLRLLPIKSQAHGEHDFDVRSLSGGLLGHLEVTRAINSGYRQTVDAIFSDKRGGVRVPRKLCRNDWGVGLQQDVRVKDVRANLDAYLSRVEQDGLAAFRRHTTRTASKSVEELCRDLNVSYGQVMDSNDPGSHWLFAPGIGGSSDPAAVNRAVLHEASKSDNLSKLSNMNVEQRHLFVVVDSSLLDAWAALIHDCVAEPLRIDAPITHLWVAAFTGVPFAAKVWHALNGDAWSSVEVDLADSEWRTLVA